MSEVKDRMEEYEAELEEAYEEKQYLSDVVLLRGFSTDVYRRQVKINKRIEVLLESIEALRSID